MIKQYTQTMKYYSGIRRNKLLTHSNHLDRFQETEWKRPFPENHILHDSTYVTFSKSQSYIDKENSSVVARVREAWGKG